jgi:hypothetical protein
MFGNDGSTLSTSASPAHHEVGCENGIWEMKKHLRITENRRRFQVLWIRLIAQPFEFPALSGALRIPVL